MAKETTWRWLRHCALLLLVGSGSGSASTVQGAILRDLDHDAFDASLAAKDDELAAARQRFDECESSLYAVLDAHTHVVADVRTLEGALESTNIKYKELEQRYRDLRSAFDRLADEHQRTEGDRDAVRAESEFLKAEIERLEEELAAVGNQRVASALSLDRVRARELDRKDAAIRYFAQSVCGDDWQECVAEIGEQLEPEWTKLRTCDGWLRAHTSRKKEVQLSFTLNGQRYRWSCDPDLTDGAGAP